MSSNPPSHPPQRPTFQELEARFQNSPPPAQNPGETAVVIEGMRQLVILLPGLSERLGELKGQNEALQRQNERWEESRRTVLEASARLGPLLDRVVLAVDQQEVHLKAGTEADQVRSRALNEAVRTLQMLNQQAGARLTELRWTGWLKQAAILVATVVVLALAAAWSLNSSNPHWNLGEQDWDWMQTGRMISGRYGRMTPAQREAFDALLEQAGETPSAP